MNDPFEFDGLDFDGEGYFAFEEYELPPGCTVEAVDSPWERWVATLALARNGDFRAVPQLLDLYHAVDDWVLKGLCVELLGDASSTSTLLKIRGTISSSLAEATYKPQLAVDLCDVLFAHRRLEDIPLLWSVYEDGVRFEDTDILLFYMRQILGGIFPEGGARHLDQDRTVVFERYRELMGRYATGAIALWQGEPFSVERLARYTLASARELQLPELYRHVFESTTGIDCRPFFKNGRFLPLSAAAIVEEFLRHFDPARYEEGKRYFFGHRIPI
jgi:hypothetical protein